MKEIASIKDIKSLLVNVSEEITPKNLFNFSTTSLNLNNISYTSSDTIYCTYLKYSKQYQIFVFENSFKYMIFELINNFKDISKNSNITIFSLYITKEFFTIYSNNSLYAYQKINQEYSKEELIEYITKNFHISISDVFELNEVELNQIITDKNIKKETFFKNINIKSKKVFFLYLIYLAICIFGTVAYENYKENTLLQHKLIKEKEQKLEYSKMLKMLKFNPFKLEYEKLVKTINKFELKLISFNYNSKVMNIKLSSKKKNNIYLFLNHYKKNLLGNSIVKSNSTNLFLSVINVKTN